MIGNSIAGFLGTGVAAVTSSYESIASFTGNGSAIAFSSIPQTYKSLQIRAQIDTGGSGFQMYFNDTAGTSYSSHSLKGVGSGTPVADASTSSNNLVRDFYAGYPAGYVGFLIADIIDYENTSKNTTVRWVAGMDTNNTGDAKFILLGSGLYLSTTAVTKINFGAGLNSNSKVALYGIKG
jgi:hypothetical protein